MLPSRALASLAVLAFSAVVLAGCTPTIEARPTSGLSPSAALRAALGTDGEAGDALVSSLEETRLASIDLLSEVGEEVLARVGHPEYVPAGGGFGPAPLRTVVPGLDEPIVVVREGDTASAETSAGTRTATGRVEHTVSDQTSSFVVDHTTTVSRDGVALAQDARQSNVTAAICAPDDDGTVSADWTLERRIEDTDDDGTRTRLEISARATVTSGATPRDTATIDDFELRVTRTTTAPDGTRSVDRGTLEGRFDRWGSDVIPTTEEFQTLRDARGDLSSEWFSAEIGNLLMGTLGASTHEFMAVLRTALEARQESGLCVTLEYDTGGVTALADGETATITAWVVDTRTRERVDADIAAETFDGSVTPDRSPSEATFTFTASGDRPVKTVYLSTKGPLGGDRASVDFTSGWSFEGVEMSVSVDDYTGYQQWSGHVCGDPFTEPWHFVQVVDGFVVEYNLVVPPLGTRINSEYGQQPMIERVPSPADDEPPFRLYIDDIEPPEVTPQAQRVEVEVRPGAVACEG